MGEIIQLVRDLGFPIAVSAYLLYRDSTVIKSLTESINSNTLAVTKLVQKMNDEESGE